MIELLGGSVLVATEEHKQAILRSLAELRQRWPHLPPAVQRKNAIYLEIFAVCGLISAEPASGGATTARQELAPPSHWLTTQQVAELAPCSPAYARRVGPEHGARYYRGRWFHDPKRVEEYLRRDRSRIGDK